jgi:Tol biopolymer transport system component
LAARVIAVREILLRTALMGWALALTASWLPAGPEGKSLTWLVRDGGVLDVDRSGNRDLTDPRENVVADNNPGSLPDEGASSRLQRPGKIMKLVTREVSLGQLNAGALPDSVVVSPDSRHLAFVERQGNKWRVVLDGVACKEYEIGSRDPSGGLLFFLSKRLSCSFQHPDRNGTLRFSPDSRRLAYVARRDRKLLVVVDGKEGHEHDGVANQCLVFSPDSQRVGYMAFSFPNKWKMIVNSVGGKQYDCMGEGLPFFSPDSKRLAYVAEQNGKQFVVRDGEEGRPYGYVYALSVCFSPDSKRLAYAVAGEANLLQVGGKRSVVVDGIEGKQYDGIAPVGADEDSNVLSLFFSPDSRRLAYVAKQGSKKLLVTGGVEGKPYDEIFPTSLTFASYSQQPAYPIELESGATVFSPDSRRVAYMAVRDRKSFLVLDGVETKQYDVMAAGAVLGPLFSPDSRRIAFIGARPRRIFVCIDGKEGKEYDGIVPGTLLFSPDSMRVAYVALRLPKMLVVVDGQEGKEYDAIADVHFSPDSQHVAYVARRDKRQFVVADGAEGNEYDQAGANLRFSPDSQHLAYGAARVEKSLGAPERRNSLIIVDGLESKSYDGGLRGSTLIFDSPNSLHTLAHRNREIFRVELQIIEQ